MSPSSSSRSVTAVVVSHNEGDNVRRTVHSLLASLPADGEIVVVDDASTDGSLDFVTRSYGSVRVLRPAVRLGVARARNFGARAARGELLVFSDAHVETGFDWLGPVQAALSSPLVGAVGPVIAAMGEPMAKGYGYTLVDANLNTSWLGWQGSQPHPVPCLCGCFLAMRRDVFRAVGGFDSGFMEWGAEDTELSLRLWLLGYECRVLPEVEVAHLFRPALPYEADPAWSLHNSLRTAAVHFSERHLELVFARASTNVGFPAALARLLGGDVGDRRRRLLRRRSHDDAWFFDRFEISLN